MSHLPSELRKKLENTVLDARPIAEAAAEAAVSRLGVGLIKAPDYLKGEEPALRRRLRAHARQLGDGRTPDGTQDTMRLVRECAYEHWHRMLFSRFLAENDLLIHPEMQVAVSLAECEEMAQQQGCDAWEMAGRYAAAMLPAIFRPDDAVLAVAIDPVARRKLENLLANLPTEIFTAKDSLGWVYQFWQADAKKAVNKSEVKIGADELPVVTQLFTEPYMVQFLLHNSLGAWWAAKRLTPAQLAGANGEQELRDAVALPGYNLSYLRFVRDDKQLWKPAAGVFEHWPQRLNEFTALDPCCGSGHFLVALLELLARLRMAEGSLTAGEAVDAVLRENLRGLEIDPRCTQIAVFAVALSAWTFPDAGGYRSLPPIQVACSGLRVTAKREEWMALADRVTVVPQRDRLRAGMSRLWDVFQQAPVLGSLIDPGQAAQQKDIFTAGWSELQPLLQQALSDPRLFDTEDRVEIGVAARGLAVAASLLTQSYSLIATNVPYLGRLQHSDILRDWIDVNFSESKADLATVFLKRLNDLLDTSGSAVLVTPQNWLNLGSYTDFRSWYLKSNTMLALATLGEESWQTFGNRGPRATLTIHSRVGLSTGHMVSTIDCTKEPDIEKKISMLIQGCFKSVDQVGYYSNPDHRITMDRIASHSLLAEKAVSLQGTSTGDTPRFVNYFWERDRVRDWQFYNGAPDGKSWFSGMSEVVNWKSVEDFEQSAVRGGDAFGKNGFCVRQMRSLFVGYYSGSKFDNNTAVIVPSDSAEMLSIACYLRSEQYTNDVRSIDQKVNVTNASLVKVPFDSEYWKNLSRTEYPRGLPKPYSDDPRQWIFHGHPCGSVMWDEAAKWTVNGPSRRNASVLHIALARLIGYCWPAELDDQMELATEQRAWAQKCAELIRHADDDGIVCLPAIRGERPAADRLRELLADAYGSEWSAGVLSELLTVSGHPSMALDAWLRDYSFKEHCGFFEQRPFMWHIWDGSKDGFHALVNYHKLNRRNFENLIYTYLGDWISVQERAAKAEDTGAGFRLAAATALKEKLELILNGEAPHDIFVRWKPMSQQPAGWNPDLDDGVRLNIRPFITAGVLRWNPPIKYTKDRGGDPESAPWYHIFGDERINDHHTTLAEKQAARGKVKNT